MTRLALALLALCLALGGSPAQAQLLWPPMVCTSYSLAGPDKPPDEIAAFLRDLGAKESADSHFLDGVAMRKCDNGELRDYALQMPVRFDLGVCHFDEIAASELFSKEGKYLGMDGPAKIAWDRPGQQMQVSTQPCPKQDDPRYVRTGSVPPGIFREFVAIWQRIVTSKQTLGAIVMLAPNDADSARNLRHLQEALARDPDAVTVQGVGLYTVPYSGDTPAFRFQVGRGESGWILGFDLAPDGWRIVKIGSWIV